MKFDYKNKDFYGLFNKDHIVGKNKEVGGELILKLFNGNRVYIFLNKSQVERKVFSFGDISEDWDIIEIKVEEIPKDLFII